MATVGIEALVDVRGRRSAARGTSPSTSPSASGNAHSAVGRTIVVGKTGQQHRDDVAPCRCSASNRSISCPTYVESRAGIGEQSTISFRDKARCWSSAWSSRLPVMSLSSRKMFRCRRPKRRLVVAGQTMPLESTLDLGGLLGVAPGVADEPVVAEEFAVAPFAADRENVSATRDPRGGRGGSEGSDRRGISVR